MGSDRKKIFLGVVAYGAVDPEILEDYMRLSFHCGRRMPEYDFFLGVKSKSEQFRARNAIVDAAMKVGADYLYMVDDDMLHDTDNNVGPTESYDIIAKLIAHKKDVCGALYYQRKSPHAAVLMRKVHDRGYRFLRDDEIEGKLQKVDVAGGGCLLINMKIFDKIKSPYFGPEFEFGTDIQLARSAYDAGFEVWADTSIELGHLRSEKVAVTSKNRHHSLLDTVPGEVRTQFTAGDIYGPLLADVLDYTGYKDIDDLGRHANFLGEWDKADKTTEEKVYEWYRRFPMERVARQYVYNTLNQFKADATMFILASVQDGQAADIMDYGCGIGITAFALAQRGHNVTAVDIAGTGTLEFLKWRAKKHNVRMKFIERTGGPVDYGTAAFDAVIAMDTFEHTPAWREELGNIAAHIKDGGALFANNAVLDDPAHPEHYELDKREFVSECVKGNLMPYNQITYVKKEMKCQEAQ